MASKPPKACREALEVLDDKRKDLAQVSFKDFLSIGNCQGFFSL
jgi:hypothetical protein